MDVASMMSHGTLFVGNDSGLMHVAYALPLPVVALFGPSRDHMYGPFPADAHTVVRTPESYEEITKRSDYSPSAQINFMETLSVDTVWEAVDKAFSRVR
jgi:ADP-heptose:LPS heptosyltransferase